MCGYHDFFNQDLSSGTLQFLGLIPIGFMALHERHKPPLSTSVINAAGNLVQGGILVTTPMMILGSGYIASALLWSVIMIQRYFLNVEHKEEHFSELVKLYQQARPYLERLALYGYKVFG